MAEEHSILELVTTAVISAGVVSAVVGIVFKGYVTRIEHQVKSQRTWKEQSVSQLLGPLNIQFDRTERAFKRWRKQNLYLEAKVIKVGNEKIRDLLLEKSHLIPPELLEDAGDLVQHFDVWLEMFEKQRGQETPDAESSFVFAGPQGYPFPREAEAKFKQTYQAYWNDLYKDV